MLTFACKKEKENKIISFSGLWERRVYIWNGNMGTDTVNVQQNQNLLNFTNDTGINEIGYLDGDTIKITQTDISGFEYLVIKSDTEFISNSPVNRTIDSIEFLKIK